MKKEKIDLDYPVTVDGVEIKKLDMRRPKVRDQINADKPGGTDGEKEIRLFANLCEVTPETIEELDLYDYTKLQDEYSSFLSSAPKSAGKRS